MGALWRCWVLCFMDLLRGLMAARAPRAVDRDSTAGQLSARIRPLRRFSLSRKLAPWIISAQLHPAAPLNRTHGSYNLLWGTRRPPTSAVGGLCLGTGLASRMIATRHGCSAMARPRTSTSGSRLCGGPCIQPELHTDGRSSSPSWSWAPRFRRAGCLRHPPVRLGAVGTGAWLLAGIRPPARCRCTTPMSRPIWWVGALSARR